MCNRMSRMTHTATCMDAVQMVVSPYNYHSNFRPITKPSSTVPKLSHKRASRVWLGRVSDDDDDVGR